LTDDARCLSFNNVRSNGWRSCGNCGERTAQIMTKYRYELLAQLGRFRLLLKLGLTPSQPRNCLEIS
jgi:hypothetical protein